MQKILILLRDNRVIKKYWFPLFCLIAVPLLAHLLYSRYGFDPRTDYGFILSQSRRLIDGQVPHSDFISIRPVGSALLHLPEVLIGGEYVHYLSRFVLWFQFALISYIWTLLLAKNASEKENVMLKLVIFICAFIFNSHNFLLTPWHTVDAIMLVSIGYYLGEGRNGFWKNVGLFIMAQAYICKQNFLPLAVIVLFLSGRWKEWKAWLIIALPGILYAIWIILTGAEGDAVQQLLAQSNFLESAITKYSVTPIFLGGFVSSIVYLAFVEYYKRLHNNNILTLSPILFYLLLLPLTINLYNGFTFINAGFYPLGFVLGLILGQTIAGIHQKNIIYILFIVAVAWMSSISMGYQTPALASGILVAVLLTYIYISCQEHRHKTTNIIFWFSTLCFTILNVFSYNNARLNFVYTEPPAVHLNSSISDVYYGAKGLRTNSYTRMMLADLRGIINENPNRKYAVLPDFASYWAKSEQPNPLSIDWALDQELYDYGHNRIHGELDQLTTDGGVIIMQKIPADYPFRSITKYIPEHYLKIDETPFFEIYQ